MSDSGASGRDRSDHGEGSGGERKSRDRSMGESRSAVSADALLADTGAIARRLDGFEVRPQQLEMAAAVRDCFAKRGRLMVEAGTGVGKSFAYLIPAIERIVSARERVVVVTHTINLQEQLIEKDIPLLNAVIPEEFSAVLVKGRGNYVSLRRLQLASRRADRLLPDEEERHALQQIEQWAYETRDGSLSTLPELARPSVWEHAQSDAHNCMGRRCPTYDKCFYQAARRRMEHGDLLVCNHALFFADLAMRARGASFLPPYQHVIIDEAHEAEMVASEHFGLRVSEAGIEHLLRSLYNSNQARGFLTAARVQPGAESNVSEAVRKTIDAGEACRAFFDGLALGSRSDADGSTRLREPIADAEMVVEPLRQLAGTLRLLKGKLIDEEDDFEVNSYAIRAADMATNVESLTSQSLPGCVYWAERGVSSRRRAGKRGSVSLRCAAIDAAPILAEHLFGRDCSVVLTSATLTTARGDFTHAAARFGCPDAATLDLGSPFDFARQVRFHVDSRMPAPDSPDFLEALAPRVLSHLRATDGGAFVLFTSFAMLEQLARRLEPELVALGHPVLVQGRGVPRGLLLRRFRDDERSVLFGTASFWQGIDVRGRALRNVIICKLPFDPPDQPLVEARRELIEERGGNPFGEDQLPRAVLRFRQGFGRLVRSSQDTGRVVVLDPRIVTKRYGRAFIQALPEGVEPIDDGMSDFADDV